MIMRKRWRLKPAMSGKAEAARIESRRPQRKFDINLQMSAGIKKR